MYIYIYIHVLSYVQKNWGAALKFRILWDLALNTGRSSKQAMPAMGIIETNFAGDHGWISRNSPVNGKHTNYWWITTALICNR